MIVIGSVVDPRPCAFGGFEDPPILASAGPFALGPLRVDKEAPSTLNLEWVINKLQKCGAGIPCSGTYNGLSARLATLFCLSLLPQNLRAC